MDSVKLSRKDFPQLKALFPDYKGRKIHLYVQDTVSVLSHDLFWSGGYKTEIAFLNINGEISGIDTTMVSPYRIKGERKEFEIPDDVAIVFREFAGSSQWINVYVSPNSQIFPAKLLK